jgi:hypothetical protein
VTNCDDDDNIQRMTDKFMCRAKTSLTVSFVLMDSLMDKVQF